MNKLILIAFVLLLSGCGIFFETVKVGDVKVTIFNNKAVQENIYELEIGVVSSNLRRTITTEQEQYALEETFKEQSYLLCLPKKPILTPYPRVVRKVNSGSIAYTYEVWYHMQGRVSCN